MVGVLPLVWGCWHGACFRDFHDGMLSFVVAHTIALGPLSNAAEPANSCPRCRELQQSRQVARLLRLGGWQQTPTTSSFGPIRTPNKGSGTRGWLWQGCSDTAFLR